MPAELAGAVLVLVFVFLSGFCYLPWFCLSCWLYVLHVELEVQH